MTRNPRNDARSCEAIRTPCRKGGSARRPFPSGRGQRPIAKGLALSNEATAATGSDLRGETVQIEHDHPMAAAQLHDASRRPSVQKHRVVEGEAHHENRDPILKMKLASKNQRSGVLFCGCFPDFGIRRFLRATASDGRRTGASSHFTSSDTLIRSHRRCSRCFLSD
jgi:hypothetical protein